MAGKRQDRSDVREVMTAYPPGTRLVCTSTGSTYQIGAKHGSSDFWMMREGIVFKRLVDAATVLREFERVKE